MANLISKERAFIMMFTGVINVRSIVVLLACVVNIGYLSLLYDVLPTYTCSSWSQIPVAYNFYKYSAFSPIIEEIENKTQKAVPIGKCKGLEKPSANDTVGYAFLVGSLWKLTGSCDLVYIQLLQIALFCLMIFLIYQMVFLLFLSSSIAFISSLLLIFWHKLIVSNVMPARDIWAFYGGVVLSYALLKFFLEKGSYSYRKIFLAALFFAFCQFLRPNIFGQFLTLCVVFLLLSYFYQKKAMMGSLKVVALVMCANIIFFWIPFMGFNKATYGRYFVGPLGHGLLASLGTVANPWGLECDDNVLVAHVKNSYSLVENDVVATNDAQFQEFLKFLKEKPSVYVRAVLLSLRRALFYEIETGMRFIYSYCQNISSFKNKLEEKFRAEKLIEQQKETFKLAIVQGSSLRKLLELLVGKILILCGYFGIFVLLLKRRFIAIVFLMGGVFGGCWMLCLSHFEERYIIPLAWPFAVFAGYFLVFFWRWIIRKLSNYYCKSFVSRKVFP